MSYNIYVFKSQGQLEMFTMGHSFAMQIIMPILLSTHETHHSTPGEEPPIPSNKYRVVSGAITSCSVRNPQRKPISRAITSIYTCRAARPCLSSFLYCGKKQSPYTPLVNSPNHLPRATELVGQWSAFQGGSGNAFAIVQKVCLCHTFWILFWYRIPTFIIS